MNDRPELFPSWRAAFVCLSLACILSGLTIGMLVLAFTSLVGVP